MGSFSVSCVLTGVTLANQDAVLIPLAPTRGGNRQSPSAIGGSYVVSNEGAAAIFGALTLPIIGAVGDYGDMESIHEDANVRFLREQFGDEFDNFIEGCCRGGHTKLTDKLAREVNITRYNKKKPGWDGTLSGCWIAKEAWDKFSREAWDEGGGRRESVGTDGWLDPKNLLGMGFKPGTPDKDAAIALFGDGHHEGTRYYHPYTHKDLPELIVWCDDHMSSEASYKGKPLAIKYKYSDFVAAITKVGLTVPRSMSRWASRTSVYRGHLLEARDEIRQKLEMDIRHDEFLAKHPDMRWHMIKEGSDENTQVFCTRRSYKDEPGSHRHIILKRDGSHSVTGCPGRKDHTDDYSVKRFEFTPEVFETIKAMKSMGWRMPKERRARAGLTSPYLRAFPEETLNLYGDKLLSNKFLPMVERFLCLEGNLYAANRILTPTASGWQCGNNATQREVATMALKLVGKREARSRRYR